MKPNTAGERRGERGQMLAIVALLMPVFLGFVAVVIDLGLTGSEVNRAQSAADAAAWSAAVHIRRIGDCSDATRATAVASVARYYAKHSGFDNDGTSPDEPGVTVTVTCPDAGNAKRVRVSVERPVPGLFRGIVFAGTVTSQAVAVGATVSFPSPHALIALDTTCSTEGIKLSGAGNLAITGGGAASNLCHGTCSACTSGSGDIIAPTLDVRGGCSGTTPACNSLTAPVPDPLKGTLTRPCSGGASPSLGGCANYSSVEFNGGNFTEVIGPSVYRSINPGNGTLWLRPGIYVLAGKGMNYSGNGSLKMCRGAVGEPVTGHAMYGAATGCTGVTSSTTGVLIYNTIQAHPVYPDPCPPGGSSSADKMNLSGDGSLDLAAHTSGPYAGLTVWQDECVFDKDFNLSGNGSVTISGTFYSPQDDVQYSGNGTLTMNAAMYAKRFQVSGSGSLNLTYSPTGNFHPDDTTLVE